MTVPEDGGSPGDATVGGAEIELLLGTREEALPVEWELTEAWVALGEVRADNDRGGELEPMWQGLGRLRIDEDPPSAVLSAVPATYGGATLRSEDGAVAAFELRFRTGDEELEVVSSRPFEVMARCDEGGVGLRPSERARFLVELDLRPIAEALEEASLPEAVEGVVRVDATSAPALLVELEGAFDEAWYVSCDAS